MYELIVYTTASGKSPLKEYLGDLIKHNKQNDLTRIRAYIDRLKEHGMAVNNIFPETIRKLDGDIYELRPDKHRVVFFYYTSNQFVLLHAFKKQHGKAPPNEIKQAKKEMDDYKRRNRDA